MIEFEPADARGDHAVLTELNVEYLEWLDVNIQREFEIGLPALIGQSIAEYVATTLDKLCEPEPPEGVFYIVRRDGQVVGMGGVRRAGAGASEMKRVFVRPNRARWWAGNRHRETADLRRDVVRLREHAARFRAVHDLGAPAVRVRGIPGPAHLRRCRGAQ